MRHELSRKLQSGSRAPPRACSTSTGTSRPSAEAVCRLQSALRLTRTKAPHPLQAALQSPSVYELLPPLDFPWAIPRPRLELWLWKPIPSVRSSMGTPAGKAPAPPAAAPAAVPAAAASAGPAGAPATASACVQCPHCHALVRLQPAGPLPAGRAGEDEEPPPLLCASHAQHAVPSPPGVGTVDGGCVAGSAAGQNTAWPAWATQYIFQLDQLPGLLGRLLKDNAGKGKRGRRRASGVHSHLRCRATHAGPPFLLCLQVLTVTISHARHAVSCILKLTLTPTLLLLPAVTVGDAVVPLPFEPELWAQAKATRAAWAAAQLPSSVAFFNLYGNGVSTPWDCTYGAWWHPLQVSNHWLPGCTGKVAGGAEGSTSATTGGPAGGRQGRQKCRRRAGVPAQRRPSLVLPSMERWHRIAPSRIFNSPPLVLMPRRTWPRCRGPPPASPTWWATARCQRRAHGRTA